MSHWAEGKMNLSCALDVLRAALVKVMPEWEKHIRVDPEGRIPIYTYLGEEMKGQTFHLMVPGMQNPSYEQAPGVSYNDVGFRQLEDGSWVAQVDRHGDERIANLEERVASKVGLSKIREVAAIEGLPILSDGMEGEEEVVVVRIPVKSRQKLAI